ncbi:hypothetical protein SZ39_2714 [Bacillus mycoides]|nr:hypothetical protein [Bacillus mycoides]KIV72288.1 hypothetical protein SZ39_2714 [Bacillus mycoides]
MFEEYKLEFVKGMEMIVPAKDGKGAYQIVINVSILNKSELEKVMLSMLK